MSKAPVPSETAGTSPHAGAPLRVVLADRPGPGRRAVAGMLGRLDGVVLADIAGDGEELAVALRRRPDVLIIDDRMLDGLTGAGAGTRMLVLGVDVDPGFAARALRLGAEAWIPKDRADEQLPALLAH
jgi:DNA-binding NarL/FixJ family response regulator